MESPAGDGFAFNRPLLAEALRMPGFNSGDVLIAPLFLSPGRHAGPRGDLVRIAGEAQDASPGLRCHFTQLIGSHPAATAFLADALSRALKVGAHT
jgi:sirohydrochlorin ferrochelatase